MPATDNLVGPRKLEIEEQFSSRYGAHQCHFETNDGIWKFFFDQLAESIRQNNNAESATGHIKLIAVQFRSRREFSASQLILRRRRSTSIGEYIFTAHLLLSTPIPLRMLYLTWKVRTSGKGAHSSSFRSSIVIHIFFSPSLHCVYIFFSACALSNPFIVICDYDWFSIRWYMRWIIRIDIFGFDRLYNSVAYQQCSSTFIHVWFFNSLRFFCSNSALFDSLNLRWVVDVRGF